MVKLSQFMANISQLTVTKKLILLLEHIDELCVIVLGIGGGGKKKSSPLNSEAKVRHKTHTDRTYTNTH